MRILVYGAGIIGSLYAARLYDVGHEVYLLARGRRHDELREHGVVLESFTTGERSVHDVRVVEELKPDDHYDLVIVSMQRNQALDALPALALNTVVPSYLFMGNNAGGPDAYVRALGADRVLMGFPGAGGLWDGYVVKYVAGKNGTMPTEVGELGGGVTPRLQRIAEAFASAGAPVAFNDDIDAYLKCHAALVVPLVGGIYASGEDNYRLARTRDALIMVIRALKEEIRAMGALGIRLSPPRLNLVRYLPEPLLLAAMGGPLSSREAEMGVAGHARAARGEMTHLLGELRALNGEAGVETPWMDRLAVFFDQSSPPLREGSSELPVNWGGVLFALGGAAVIVLLGLWLL